MDSIMFMDTSEQQFMDGPSILILQGDDNASKNIDENHRINLSSNESLTDIFLQHLYNWSN